MSAPALDSKPPRFPIGLVVATAGATSALLRAGQSHHPFLARHQAGDWGDVCASDAAMNDDAIDNGDDADDRGRVLSSYQTALGDRIWVITEADRSATTILLPDEY